MSGAAFAQKDTVGLKLPVKDGRLVYEGIVNVTGKSKTDLYNNAKQWFVDYFRSSKDVIQNEDKELGRIVGKGIILLNIKYNFAYGRMWPDRITIQIDCKDEKYRYRIYDMTMTIPGEDLGTYGYKSAKEVTDTEILNRLTNSKDNKSSLTKGMCLKVVKQIDIETTNAIISLNKAMLAKPDNF